MKISEIMKEMEFNPHAPTSTIGAFQKNLSEKMSKYQQKQHKK